MANPNLVEFAFSFPTFAPADPSITIQGDAKILSNGILALTDYGRSTGRALYIAPVPIWDPATGNVATFVTSFSFVVQDYEGDTPGDGLAFVIVPSNQTDIPRNSGGGNLGLADDTTAYNQFVAVEFDSYLGQYDPDYIHVGINVNSLISLKTVKWERVSGALVRVTIRYDSLSNELSVTAVTHPNGEITSIAQVIDLKAVLPAKVRVGFSAASGGSREKHEIHSWSFKSTLDTSSTRQT